MTDKAIGDGKRWTVSIVNNETLNWKKTSYSPCVGKHGGGSWHISDEDMQELYKVPKFKEIIKGSAAEELILGNFPKGWKTVEQVMEEN